MESPALRAKQHNQKTRENLLWDLTGINPERMDLLTVCGIRERVVERFPRVLEVMFTDAETGKPYTKAVLLHRLTSYPQLLRYHKGA